MCKRISKVTLLQFSGTIPSARKFELTGVIQVLEGGTLNIRDKYSFDRPPIKSQADWEMLQNKIYADAERFASLVHQLSDEQLMAGFVKEEYGNYFRNLLGMTEHSYYHLGQIVLIKKHLLEH